MYWTAWARLAVEVGAEERAQHALSQGRGSALSLKGGGVGAEERAKHALSQGREKYVVRYRKKRGGRNESQYFFQ